MALIFGLLLISVSLFALHRDAKFVQKRINEVFGGDMGEYISKKSPEEFYMNCVDEALTSQEQAVSSFTILFAMCGLLVGVVLVVVACIP